MARQALSTLEYDHQSNVLATPSPSVGDNLGNLISKVNANFVEVYGGAYTVAGGALTALAGGAQAGTALAAGINRIATVATAGDSVQLPAATAGQTVFVINAAAANSANIFPQTGEFIKPFAVNTAFALAAGAGVLFVCGVAASWQIVGYFEPVKKTTKYAANSTNTDQTITAAEVTGGDVDVVLNLTGALGAGKAMTLPLVTDLVAAIPNPYAGRSYRLRIINSSAGAFEWTVTTNTGWTLSGTMTIAQNTFRDFVVSLTSLTAATLTSVGTGTTS